MRASRVACGIAALGAALWCALFLLAPVLGASGGALSGAGDFLYRFFHGICHQMDDRSFHINGRPLGVCARCASIYLGFLAGTLVYPLLKRVAGRAEPGRWFLLLAALPMLLDVAAGLAGVHESTGATRALSGALFGVLAPLVVLPALTEAVDQMFSTSPGSPPFRSRKALHA